MKNLTDILEAAKTIGDPTFEQNKKLVEGVIVIQERIKIDLPSILDELIILQISNFCRSFNFKCQIMPIREEIQLHLYEKD